MRGGAEKIFGQPNLLRPVCDQRRRGQAGSISTLYGSEATKGVLAESPSFRSKLHALAGKSRAETNRVTVRNPLFHGGNRGSNPLEPPAKTLNRKGRIRFSN